MGAYLELRRQHSKKSQVGIKITILGTGTSQGIPTIGCDCSVCLSDDPRDKRLRVAVHIQAKGKNIIIDVGPDFRQQMLRANIREIDAILLTHEHNDHIIGLDDIRPFIFRMERAMPIYSSARVAKELKVRFAYAFDPNPYPGAPSFELINTDERSHFTIDNLRVDIIHYLHGKLPVQGYRVGNFAYLTDIKTLPEASLEQLFGLEVLIISALHQNPHHSHANLQEALDIIESIQPIKAYLTHLSHQMGKHKEVEALLPPNVSIAYDGLELSIPD